MMVWGVVLILAGLFFLYQTIKQPIKGDYGFTNLKGYAAGLLFILIGIYFVFEYFGSQ